MINIEQDKVLDERYRDGFDDNERRSSVCEQRSG